MSKARDIADIGADLDELVSFHTNTNLTVTVGAGGDYATITAALAYLSQFSRIFVNSGATVTISLLTGFVMAEQVHVKSLDLGFIRITSVDSEVVITRSALVTDFGTPSFSAFHATNATLPEIACLFNMDTSGTATSRNGICCVEGSKVRIRADCGVKNSGSSGLVLLGSTAVTGDTDVDGTALVGTGGSIFTGSTDAAVQVRNGSSAYLVRANVSGCATGIFARSSATVDFWYGNATNCTTVGLRCRDNSNMNARSSDVSGSRIGVFASHIGIVNFRYGVATACTGTGVRSFTGSTVEIADAAITGTLATSHTDVDLGYGLSVSGTSTVNGDGAGTIVTGSAGHNVYGTGACTISLKGASLINAGGRAAEAEEGARISIHDAVLTGAATGVKATTGGQIAAVNANVGTPTTGDGFTVTNGGHIFAKNATGTLSVTANTIAAAGIIFS